MEMWETADPQNECIFLQMFSARWHLMLVSSCACNQTTLCGIWHVEWWMESNPNLLLRSFHKLRDMWFTLCRHVQWLETNATVPLKFEKYLSWESQLLPDQERRRRAKLEEELSFCPVVFGLGYKWTLQLKISSHSCGAVWLISNIMLDWCLIICELLSFFMVGSFFCFFSLVTDMLLHMKSLLLSHLRILFRLNSILIWRCS